MFSKVQRGRYRLKWWELSRYASLATEGFDGFYYTGDTEMEIFDDVFFGETDDVPTDRFEEAILGFIFLDLGFSGMGFKVITFYGYSPIPARGRRAHNNKSQVNTITAALSRDGMFDYRLDAKTFQCSLNNLFGRQHTIELQNIFDESRAFKVVKPNTILRGMIFLMGFSSFRISLNSNRL